MTNTERANKWYEIIERLTYIEMRSVYLKRRLLAAHYLVFATETWLMHWDKALREN